MTMPPLPVASPRSVPSTHPVDRALALGVVAFALAGLGAAPPRDGSRVAVPSDAQMTSEAAIESVALDEARLDAAALRELARGRDFVLPSAVPAGLRLRLAATGTLPDGSRTLAFTGARDFGTSPGASASIVVRGDLVAGFVRGGDGWETTIVPIGPGRQRIVTRAMGASDCDGSLVHDGPLEPLAADDCADTPLLQDVLVVYTAEAAASWGGAPALEGLIAASILDANLAFKNSGIPQRLRLVGLEQIPFTQGASIGVDLTRLADPNDGIGDIAHVYRNASGADLVQLVSTSSGCGVAFLFDGSPSSAFSVVNADCLGGFVPAHEYGHNFGCCHASGDRGGCDGGGFYPFSNGWRYFGSSGSQWRTVMAYAPGERIPYFSNPTKFFDGQPVGAPGGGPAAANNARTVILTSATVAQFRCAVDPGADCNGNGQPDAIDLLDGTSDDCNGNGIPDECDILVGWSVDANSDGVPDECETGAIKFGPVDPPGDPRILDVFGFSGAIGKATDVAIDPTPYAVLGAYGDDEIAGNSGAAYVFGLAGPGSGQQAKLKAADAAPNAYFGRAVAAFKRGAQATPPTPARSFAAVGAYRQPDGAVAEKGAAYIFARDGGVWSQVFKQKAGDGQAKDWFGFSLSMGRIGADAHDTLVIGAPQASAKKGAVYVYRYLANDTTTLSKKLLAPLTLAGADFGWAVAMDTSVSINGGNPPAPVQRAILVAGLPGDGNGAGRVRSYERLLTANQNFPSTGQDLLLPANEANPGDRFGEALAIRDNWLAVGAPGKDGGRGAVYVYERTALQTWTPRQKLVPLANQPEGRFGSAVSLIERSDGQLLLMVGAPKSKVDSPAGVQANAGLVYSFGRPPLGSTFSPIAVQAAFDAQQGDEFGTALDAVQLSPAFPLTIWTLIGSPFDDDQGLNSGSAYMLPLGN